MRLRYEGLAPRDGWQPGEVRGVDEHVAEPLLLSGAWSLVLVAPSVTAPAAQRRVSGPGEGPWR